MSDLIAKQSYPLNEGYSHFSRELKNIKKLPITDIGDVNGLSWRHYSVSNDLKLNFFFSFDENYTISPAISKILIQDPDGNLLLFEGEVNSLLSSSLESIHNCYYGNVTFNFVDKKIPVFKQKDLFLKFNSYFSSKNLIISTLISLYSNIKEKATRLKILNKLTSDIDKKKKLTWLGNQVSFPGVSIKVAVNFLPTGYNLNFYNQEMKIRFCIWIDCNRFIDDTIILVKSVEGSLLAKFCNTGYPSEKFNVDDRNIVVEVDNLFTRLIPIIKTNLLATNMISIEQILEASSFEDRNW